MSTTTNGDAAQLVVEQAAWRARGIDGAQFVLREPEHPPAIWGKPDQSVWTEGEPLLVTAPQGLGKTTLEQRLMLHRAGIRTGLLLDMPIKAITEGRVLYLAMDRPRQAARSLKRMVTEDDEELLKERVVFWRGALPFNLIEKPDKFLQFVRAFEDIQDVYVDSLKDIAFDLSKEEVGIRLDYAFKSVVEEGIELAGNHHHRKADASSRGRKPVSLNEVYGSVWITAGAGSVIQLWGDAGDTIVDFDHLKQPAEMVGPFSIQHDHRTGEITIYKGSTLEGILSEVDHLTAMQAARRLFKVDKPSNSQREKARRDLNALVEKGIAEQTGIDHDDKSIRYTLRSGSAQRGGTPDEQLAIESTQPAEQPDPRGAYDDEPFVPDDDDGTIPR